jgi:GntR family transcriptional regulator, transcriptional repressor for pyruvate dehydrogenase complex
MKSLEKKSLSKVSRTSLVDEVIGAMRQMFNEDAWRPGAKLPSEQELGRQLGVGRSTVREALRVLGHLGLVEARSGLGTYVVDRRMPEGGVDQPHTSAGVRQLYEFRRALEVPAARLAAARRSAEQLHNIRTAWDRCQTAVQNNSADEFARLDFRFHFSIIQASGNVFYIEAYRAIETSFASYVSLILALGPLQSMLHFHDGLISAIARRDPDAAAVAVGENFLETDVRVRLLTNNAGELEDGD